MSRFRPGRLGLSFAAVAFLVAVLVAGCSRPVAEQGPWQEPFDSGDAWRLSSDAIADVQIAEGRLTVHVFEPGQVAWAASQRTFSDVQLRVEATQVSGPHDNEYGVLIRMDDDRSFYAFSISGDGYARVARYEPTGWTVLGPDWAPSEAINLGEATNVLEVTARGGQLAFSVNGQSLVQVEDGTLTEGSVGLYAGAFGEGDVVVTFDNLTIDTPAP